MILSKFYYLEIIYFIPILETAPQLTELPVSRLIALNSWDKYSLDIGRGGT